MIVALGAVIHAVAIRIGVERIGIDVRRQVAGQSDIPTPDPLCAIEVENFLAIFQAVPI